MNHRKRARRAALAAAFTTVLVVTLNPPAALADTGQPSIIPNGANGSDPHIDVCNTRENGVEKTYMCMYTSADLNLTGFNHYPMDTTYVFSIDVTNGMTVNPAVASNWQARAQDGGRRGPAFREDDLPQSKGAKHLWAPTRYYGNKTRETFLYIPDIYPNITVPGVSEDGHPAYIAVASTNAAEGAGSNPWGPFTYKKNITYLGADINPFLAQSFPDGEMPYMSDPAVTTVNLAGRGPTTYLLWANGDYNPVNHHKCGGISLGQLDDNDFTNLVSTPWRPGSEIQINGIVPELGECSPGLGHPYLEGPELYDLTQVNVPLPLGPTGQTEPYALFFAAKPEFPPPGSSTDYQVLAWASASEPWGPYTYRGILMDPSTSSWTNHGSIYATTIDDGPDADTTPDVRFLMFFHDETPNANGTHARKSRVACLVYDKSDRSFVKVPRQAPTDTTIPNLLTCNGFRD